MSQYTYRELWDRDKLEEKERTQKQLERAEKELLDGMAVAEGLGSDFWIVLKKGFIQPRLNSDRIDTCDVEDLLAIRHERTVLRDLIKFLETKAEAGKRASRFIKANKEKHEKVS